MSDRVYESEIRGDTTVIKVFEKGLGENIDSRIVAWFGDVEGNIEFQEPIPVKDLDGVVELIKDEYPGVW